MLLLRPGAANWACLSAAALAAFSIACRVQIGIRFMLPLLALAMVGLAGGLVNAWLGDALVWRRRLLLACAVLAVAWTGTSVLRVWPDGICYVNELWGGTVGGYVKVSESNYDWGQGLKELEHWHEKNPGPLAALWYSARTRPPSTARSGPPAVARPADQGAQRRVRPPPGASRRQHSLIYGYARATWWRLAGDFLRVPAVARTPTFLIFELRVRAIEVGR